MVGHLKPLVQMYIDLLVFLTEEFGLESRKTTEKNIVHLNPAVVKPLVHKFDKHLLGQDEVRKLTVQLVEDHEDLATILPDVIVPCLYGQQFSRHSERIRAQTYFVPVHLIKDAMADFVDENLAYVPKIDPAFDRYAMAFEMRNNNKLRHFKIFIKL